MREILLNIYDLNEINDYLYGMGIGFFHTGVEIQGFEFSFSSQGIIKTRPRLPQFGKFREQILMGVYNGSHHSMYAIIYKLQTSEFGVGKYHTTKKNCNHFSDTLCYELLKVNIPNWINRAANIGSVILPIGDIQEPIPPPVVKDYNGNRNSQQSERNTRSGSFTDISSTGYNDEDIGSREVQSYSTFLVMMSCFCCAMSTTYQVMEDSDDEIGNADGNERSNKDLEVNRSRSNTNTSAKSGDSRKFGSGNIQRNK
jgi:hypothetical protein